MNISTLIKTNQLQLADVVVQRPNGGTPFSTAVVVNITDHEVHLFRPYVLTADFSYTGGVIPYIGIETYNVEKSSNVEWELLERKILK